MFKLICDDGEVEINQQRRPSNMKWYAIDKLFETLHRTGLDRSDFASEIANCRGSTALHEAVFFNHLETVRWLLENGGKPSLRKKNAMGLTPTALAKNTGHGEVLKLLEEAEAAAASE